MQRLGVDETEVPGVMLEVKKKMLRSGDHMFNVRTDCSEQIERMLTCCLTRDQSGICVVCTDRWMTSAGNAEELAGECITHFHRRLTHPAA